MTVPIDLPAEPGAEATARAHPNIALVKYWGKADTAQNLPATGSLSMTLDIFPTTTTVRLDGALPADRVVLNAAERTGVVADRVVRLLDEVRALAGSSIRAHVTSINTVPSAAGLASSASGFAALATAAASAYGLDLDARALSRLARRGSGSAARSIVPRFAVWHAGTDAQSFAEEVAAPDLAMVVATVDAREKSVSSRDAMKRTVLTSPFYPAWVDSTAQSLEAALAACRDGDAERLGRITETNALRMHAVIQSCDPPIRYLSPTSVALFDRAAELRADGIAAYATADAGPNVVLLCAADAAETVRDRVADLAEAVVARPGPGAMLLPASERVAG
ncbi:diphosphomevalonate decarboxylase [Microbacterium telephonicum]|uniref:diphosphomevalonate decarboxylase n=1 Tax=Microbacterium telephonicum TaxID=1714841 RepID=A0A498C3N7_9MICO|nr:diphosphomevalonate decarboxylase [Microbacterium telephonicum]RLK49196.1 diphosphomevalonate decarboxylase [Microbacterium telephonicum]